MKRSKSIFILGLKVDTLEAKKVSLGALRLVEHSPMKRGALFQIALVDIHMLDFTKVVNAHCLITLGSHMQNGASLLI